MTPKHESVHARRRRGVRDLVITIAIALVGVAVFWQADSRADWQGATEAAEEPTAKPLPNPTSNSATPSPASGRAVQTVGVPSSPTVASQPTSGSPSAPRVQARVNDLRGNGTFTLVRDYALNKSRYRPVYYQVLVERGLPFQASVFADQVHASLVDRRGWQPISKVAFVRTHTTYMFRLFLASAATVDRLCYPLDTEGAVSCRNGRNVVINAERWQHAIPGYPVTLYRQYVINHEVGHYLGKGHVKCPGPTKPAPVMMQQTKGLLGCRANPWPSVA